MGDIVEKGQKQKELLDRIRKKAEIARTTSESLELDFRCSATKREFIVLLKRKHPDRVYRVVKIATEDTVSHPDSGLSRTVKALDIDVNEIEYGGIKCPYCKGGNWSFIKCGCGMLSCAGGVKEYEGKYLHVCPWCGTEGYVKGEIEKVSGKMQNRAEIPPSEKAKNLPPPIKGMLDQGRK
jgi:hypothetical protein